MSISACRSTAASPLNSPSRSLIVKLSICSSAVTTSTGAGRNATSAIASASTPPTPSMTIGPNCGSRIIPTMNSRAPETIGATRSETSPSSGRAAASSSSAAIRTAASSLTPSLTNPRSVLCAIASPFNLMATGPPIEAAAATAPATSNTMCSAARGTPYCFTNSFDSASDNVLVDITECEGVVMIHTLVTKPLHRLVGHYSLHIR